MQFTNRNLDPRPKSYKYYTLEALKVPVGLYRLPFIGFRAMTNYFCVTNFWACKEFVLKDVSARSDGYSYAFS